MQIKIQKFLREIKLQFVENSVLWWGLFPRKVRRLVLFYYIIRYGLYNSQREFEIYFYKYFFTRSACLNDSTGGNQIRMNEDIFPFRRIWLTQFKVQNKRAFLYESTQNFHQSFFFFLNKEIPPKNKKEIIFWSVEREKKKRLFCCWGQEWNMKKYSYHEINQKY